MREGAALWGGCVAAFGHIEARSGMAALDDRETGALPDVASVSKRPPQEAECHFSASTVQRWLDAAGARAEKTVEGQLEGAKQSTAVGVDGLWQDYSKVL